MSADWIDVLAYWVALPVAIILTAHGLDDLCIDLFYYLRGLSRTGHEALTVERLRAKEPQRIAMMVPAWHEAAVIDRMLENAITTLDYDPDLFDIFVGTYPNDPETRQKVGLIAARIPQVHEVCVPHDGPTSKADCLNWVYQGIRIEEERRGVRFDILVMHDSEDVIHPLALRHYNYWVPRCDFVQTPVLPLEVPLHQVVGGTYIDEFTEHHLKDMIVRGRIGGLVPSAGVGSAFARDAFEEIALSHGQLAFDVESLTEDYEIALKLRLAGKRTLFAADTVEHEREVRGSDGVVRRQKVKEFIATREFFPTSLRASIRQRSRWILGIGFQTWEKVGWKGPLPVLYSLYRDRRALVSHLTALAGYLIMLYCGARFLIAWLTGTTWSYDRLFATYSLLFWLVIVNTALVAWRMAVKVITIKRVYGWPQSLMSIARFPVTNVVSFLATFSAARQYITHKITKEPLRWKKTEHVFPDMEPLRRFHQRLGDILRTREGLSEADLARGLALSGQSGHRLGEVLEHMGAARAGSIDRALAMQHTLPAIVPDAASIPRSLLAALPEEEAAALGVLPLSESDGWAVVACSDPLSPEAIDALSARLGHKVRLAFCGTDRLARARTRAYRRLRHDGGPERPSLLGERLMFAGLLDERALRKALEEQAATSEHLAEILVRQGMDPAAIAEVALPPLQDRFVALRPEDVDRVALRKLGYAACVFHDLVPLLPAVDARTIVSAHPIHASTLARLEERLGGPVRAAVATRASVRVARVAAAREAWPRGIHAGHLSSDAAELVALARAHLPPRALGQLGADACALGGSPLRLALERGVVRPDEGCRLASEVYLLERGTLGPHHAGWLPPELDRRGELTVVSAAPRELLVATTIPDVAIARQLRALHPERAIRWRAAPARITEAAA